MRFSFVCLLPCVLVCSLFAQTAPGTTKVREQLRALPHLRHVGGAIPTAYVPTAKERALGYQRSLEKTVAWVEQQTGLHVPMELYVLDPASYANVVDGNPWPIPYSDFRPQPNVVVFPTRIEEIAGRQPQETLPGEYILFHEAGHNYAHALHIGSGNLWVNELIANIFMASYADAERPEMKWVFGGPAAYGVKKNPRYTSLRDLDYVYSGVGALNYAWYQEVLEQIASYLVEGQTLKDVLAKLQVEFPEDHQRQESLEQVIAHLDHIRPGSAHLFEPIAGPASLKQIALSACPAVPVKASSEFTTIGVRNDTAKSITVTSPDGKPETLAPAAWDAFLLKVGEMLTVDGKGCLRGESEPALAVISR